MKIEKITQPIYRVEFNEDVLRMLKDVLGNMGSAEMRYIGVDENHHGILLEFYNLLESI